MFRIFEIGNLFKYLLNTLLHSRNTMMEYKLFVILANWAKGAEVATQLKIIFF